MFYEIIKKYSSSKLTIINLIINHVYGPGDNSTKFIPWLINSLLTNQESLDFSDGENTIDFIYIEDVLSNYMVLLGLMNKAKIKPRIFHDYYVGNNEEIELKELILTTKQLVEQITNKEIITELNFGVFIKKEIEKNYRENQPYWLKENHWSLKEGLEKTIKYYLNQTEDD